MPPLDKVARDIFWTRQGRGARGRGTKAAQWLGMSEEARESWRMVARHFVALLDALPVDTLNLAHGCAVASIRAGKSRSHYERHIDRC